MSAEGWLDFELTADDKISECAVLTVPLDYARPNEVQVKLAVSRIKATDHAAAACW